jgi:hypothetical protein
MQYGFRLIVSMMGKKNPISMMAGQHSVTHAASRRLDTFTRASRYLNMHYVQRNAQFLAHLSTRFGPGVGTGAKSMVNMER